MSRWATTKVTELGFLDTSFQIPLVDNMSDLLLANNDDFLDSTEDSIGPWPGRGGSDLLTLGQHTPKSKPRTNKATAMPSALTVTSKFDKSSVLDKPWQDMQIPTKPEMKSTGEVGPKSTKVDVTTMIPSHRQMKKRSLTGEIVISRSGPIPKPVSCTAEDVVPAFNIGKTPATSELRPPNTFPNYSMTKVTTHEQGTGRLREAVIRGVQSVGTGAGRAYPGQSRNVDVSVCATNPGPVAENLVASFGLANSEENFSNGRQTAWHDLVGGNDTTSLYNTGISTQADLSPQKSTNVVPDQTRAAALHKRKHPDSGSSPEHPRKKGKINDTVSGVAVLELSTRSNIQSSTGSGSSLSASGVDGAVKGCTISPASRRVTRTMGRKGREAQGECSTSAKDHQPSRRKKRKNKGANPEFKSRPTDEAPQTVPTHTNSTKAIGFNSRLDRRLGLSKTRRQGETLTGSQKLEHWHPIPDFKALHAAQEAKSVTRRLMRVPLIPKPLHSNTEDRIRERRKFDEMIKEKERENERAMEEKRRQREEQEEQEIKELRKRAVPKAHEVPEWYATVVRRRKPAGQANGMPGPNLCLDI